MTHPLELVLADEALDGGTCREISDLVLRRWPSDEGKPPAGRLVPAHLVERLTEIVERDVRESLPNACCQAHALARLAAYWYLHGYQAAQWVAARDAPVDVPDHPPEADP